jgi:hypothetical protein
MKEMPHQMAQRVGQALTRTELAHSLVTRIIGDPKGRPAEALEDALNELQDAAYEARRAFRVEAVR